MTTIAYCPECQRDSRISEPYAFRGMDRLRATLSCGHIVLRDTAGLDAPDHHSVSVKRSGGHGYPYRAHCDCGWQSKSYAATHAAQTMGAEHEEGAR
jgi:hypothetical protein